MSEPIRRIAVIGAGTIGCSWAAYFLAHGFDVTIWDPKESAEGIGRRVRAAWPALEKRGLSPDASLDRMHTVSDPLKAVAYADFVQENGPENEALKIDLLARLDSAAQDEAVIASSSSGLKMTRLQEKCRHPERCLIGHPFNPPHLMPLVEVVGGKKTSEQSIERAMDFYRSIDKHPIRLHKEVTGHVGNRLQAALWREAVFLIDSGVASVADIDAAVRYGPGPRWALMGPSLTFHLGGGEGGMRHFLEHLGGAVQSWFDDLGSPSLTPSVQQKLIDGVAEEVDGQSVSELVARRDEQLNAILDVLSPRRKPIC